MIRNRTINEGLADLQSSLGGNMINDKRVYDQDSIARLALHY